METRRETSPKAPATNSRRTPASTLSPFPEGWYFIASRKSLLKEKIIQKTWMGEEIVVWCNDEGRVCVAEATCPHLGADLRPSSGGEVHNGCLVCPFHGFEYDVTGACVATPYAPAPKATRLRVFESQEVLDMVFAWWGIDGRPPQWPLPEEPKADDEWSELGFRTLRFAGHPQETTENSVDLAHLRYVHGYDSVSRIDPLTVSGAHLKSNFLFRRPQKIAGIKEIVFDVAARADIHGLGYSYVEIHDRYIEMHARLWVLATPVDGTDIEMVLVSQVKLMRNPKRTIVGMKFLPVRLRTNLMRGIILHYQEHDVVQDVVIWKHKRYVSQPRLCRSDGEIGKFRRYCRQFYPESQD